MKKKIVLVASVLCISSLAFAQQDIALTHFSYNKMGFNPGATGIDEGLCFSTVMRNQWDKVNGAPNSVAFNGEMHLPSFDINHNAGVGLNVTHDAIGFNRQTNLSLSYSHHFEIGPGKLGVGISLGMVNFGLSPTWVPPQTLADAVLPVASSTAGFDANLGLFYKAPDWYAGISATHIPGSALGVKTGSGGTPAASTTYDMAQHFFAMGGYTFKNVAGGNIDVQGLMQTELTHYSFNINARYIWRDFLYGGLAFRTADAISPMLGVKFVKGQNLRGTWTGWAGYSYDANIGTISKISNGTHEIALKFCYIPIIPITKSKHPRWL
jgi:type IX secretion system PorP/SprF family membrane protein